MTQQSLPVRSVDSCYGLARKTGLTTHRSLQEQDRFLLPKWSQKLKWTAQGPGEMAGQLQGRAEQEAGHEVLEAGGGKNPGPSFQGLHSRGWVLGIVLSGSTVPLTLERKVDVLLRMPSFPWNPF